MAQLISKDFLAKRLTGDQLNAKVGALRINGKRLSGGGLKKMVTGLGGKTPTQIEKILKDKYGVAGYQREKREKLMGLIRGSKNNSGLTPEQIKRNLRNNIIFSRMAPESKIGFASQGAARIKGTAANLNPINHPKNIGFAGGGVGSSASINQTK